MKKLALLGLVLVTLGSCKGTTDSNDEECIRGSGFTISREYTVSDFNKISVYTVADVSVSIGEERSLWILGEDNVLEVLNIDVRDKELRIGKDNCFKKMKALTVVIFVPSLKRVEHYGVGSIIGDETIVAKDFEAVISGMANMNFDLDVENVYGLINGTGDITLTGKADQQRLLINGAGSFNAFELEGLNANVLINGSGSCRVNVNQALDVGINGTGYVYYKGDPSVSSSISGVGGVEKRD